MGLMASLNENGKSCPHRGLILGPSTNYTIFVFAEKCDGSSCRDQQ